jgi:hypothetical protein
MQIPNNAPNIAAELKRLTTKLMTEATDHLPIVRILTSEALSIYDKRVSKFNKTFLDRKAGWAGLAGKAGWSGAEARLLASESSWRTRAAV